MIKIAASSPRRPRQARFRMPAFYSYKLFSNIRGENVLNICSPDTQSYLVGLHSISSDDFEELVGGFFFPYDIPSPTTWPREQIDEWLAGATPKELNWTYNENNKTDNNMTLNPDWTGGRYSACLFKGIIRLYPETAAVDFYKAIGAEGYTAVFVATDDSNQALYLGDLSGLFP